MAFSNSRNEKKNLMKFFFFGVEPFLGYCPNYIVKKKKKKLYCKKVKSIASWRGLFRLENVLQYSGCIAEMEEIVLQERVWKG